MRRSLVGAVLTMSPWLLTPANATEDPGKPLVGFEVTKHFEFHSHFWINLHHFLYRTAERSKGDDENAVIDTKAFSELSKDHRDAFNSAVRYYRKHLIKKDLLFNNSMSRFKTWVVTVPSGAPLTTNEFDAVWIAELNRVQPVYEKYFWSEHNRRNHAVVADQRELIKRIEARAFKRLAKLAHATWPSGLIRVDVTYYSNWAGGYTTTKPFPHVVLLSDDDGPVGHWIEFLVHEVTHVLIGPNNGAVASAIASASEKTSKKPPRQLWHSILFFMAGRVTQDLLAEQGVDYELMMVRNDIFAQHYPFLPKHLDLYLAGTTDLQSAVDAIVNEAGSKETKLRD